MRLTTIIITAFCMLLSASLSAQEAALHTLWRCIDTSAMARGGMPGEISHARRCAVFFASDFAKCLSQPAFKPAVRLLERGRADSAMAWIEQSTQIAGPEKSAMQARLSVLSLSMEAALQHYGKALQGTASPALMIEYSECLTAAGQHQKALDLAASAIGASASPACQQRARLAEARALMGMRQPAKALSAIEEAMAIKPGPASKDAAFMALELKAKALVQTGQPMKALPCLEQALRECRKGAGAISGRLRILCSMSRIYEMQGSHAEAAQCLESAMSLAAKLPSPAERHIAQASICLQWGTALKVAGNLDMAREKLQQSLLLIGRAVMLGRALDPMLAEIEAAMAAVEIEMNDYRRAEAMCEEASSIYSQPQYASMPETLPGKASLLRTCGDLYAATGRFVEAGRKYSEALLACKALENSGNQECGPEMAMTLNNMGMVHESLGNFGEAIASYKAAAAGLHESIEAKPVYAARYASVLSSIGNLYRKRNQPDSSLKYMEEALGIFRARQDLSDSEKAMYAKICNNLGLQYREIGKMEIAEPFFESAYSAAKFLQAKSPAYRQLWADILNNYGLYCVDTGDADLGLYYLEMALEIRQETTRNNEASAALADSYDNIGDVCMAMGKLEPAEQSYEQSRKIREQLVRFFPMIHYAGYAATMQKLAKAYRIDTSLFQALAVISELAEALNSIDSWEDEPLAVEKASACHNRAVILAELGREKDARDLMLMAARQYADAASEYDPRLNAEAADAFCKAGNFCCNINDYAMAENLYKEALQISKALYAQGQMPASSVVGALNSLGRMYYSTQNMEDAKKCYEQGRSIMDHDPVAGSDLEMILASAIIKLNIVEYYIYEKNSGIDDDEYSNCVKYLEETIATLKPFAGNSRVEHYYSQARLLLNNILN